MIVTTSYVDVPAAGGTARCFIAGPASGNPAPGIICYSDIFQLTPPMTRFCVRLAGYGLVAAAPEIYRRIEPAGLAIPFDDAGRTRGLEDAAKTPVAHFDEDCRAVLDWLAQNPKVARDSKGAQLGAQGFCIGGHLAFRAALNPDVRATACFYGTGIHDGKLGKDADAGSLARAGEIRGELLMVFGTKDPHLPEAGREIIDRGLRKSGVRSRTVLYPAEHAFMRDEGPRFDPEATDQAFGEMMALFRRTFRA